MGLAWLGILVVWFIHCRHCVAFAAERGACSGLQLGFTGLHLRPTTSSSSPVHLPVNVSWRPWRQGPRMALAWETAADGVRPYCECRFREVREQGRGLCLLRWAIHTSGWANKQTSNLHFPRGPESVASESLFMSQTDWREYGLASRWGQSTVSAHATGTSGRRDGLETDLRWTCLAALRPLEAAVSVRGGDLSCREDTVDYGVLHRSSYWLVWDGRPLA